jgi:hypothetical protein
MTAEEGSMIVTIFAERDGELILETDDEIMPSDAPEIAAGLIGRLSAHRVFFIDNYADLDDPKRCLFDTNNSRLMQ